MVKYLMLCFMLVIAVVFTQVKAYDITSAVNTKQESLCVVDYIDTQQKLIAQLSKIKSYKLLLKEKQAHEKIILKDKYLYATRVLKSNKLFATRDTVSMNTVLLL